MNKTIKHNLEFLLVFSIFFVGDYSFWSYPILPILTLFPLAYFIWKNPSITLRELITLVVVLLYLVLYFFVHSGNRSEASFLIPILIPFLFLLSCALTSQKIPKLNSRSARLFFFFLLFFTLLGLDPLPFGPNIEYRILAFLFIVSIIYTNQKMLSFYNSGYFLYSLFGYSRGGMLTFLFLNSLLSKLILFLAFVIILTLGVFIFYLGVTPESNFGLRSLFFSLENNSELGRILLYKNGIAEIKGFGVQELFFGNPFYFASNFYSHNVFLDLMSMFGVFPTSLLLIGISIFILKSIPLMFSPNTNYFICYFYAVFVGSFLSGGLTENWAIPVAGLLGLAKRNVTYKNSELLT